MSISVLFLVGRFLLAVPFVLIGVDRLLGSTTTPAEKAWAALGVLGAAGVVLGLWGDASALVVGLAVLGGGITECRKEGTTDDTRLRLVGLLGGALCVAALYVAVGSALDLTITEPVFDLDLR